MKPLLKTLAVVVTVFGLWLALSVREKSDDESGQAYYAAYKFCERYTPSGKNFTTISGEDAIDGKAEWLPEKKDWFARGCVDSQNAFGAVRHNTWAAHVALEGGKWRLTFLRVGDEQLVGGD